MATTTINTRPQAVNLSLYAGDDVSIDVTVLNNDGTPANLTGATAESQIRATADAVTSVDFATTVTGNVVTLALTNVQSATLPATGVWDLQITDSGGKITTIAGGRIDVAAGVTQ
jgi:hypothetical protein